VLRLLGLTHIRMATEAELADLFPECELGACRRSGNLFDMPVLVDEKLAAEGVITFTRPTPGRGPHEVRRLSRPGEPAGREFWSEGKRSRWGSERLGRGTREVWGDAGRRALMSPRRPHRAHAYGRVKNLFDPPPRWIIAK